MLDKSVRLNLQNVRIIKVRVMDSRVMVMVSNSNLHFVYPKLNTPLFAHTLQRYSVNI